MKRRKGLLDEEKFLPPLPEQLPRGVSSLPGYGQTSPVAQGLLGFTGRNPTYSVMSPEAQQMSDAYRLGEQASVASQLYSSVSPFAVAATLAKAGQIPGASMAVQRSLSSAPRDDALEIARQNAVKMLGLPEANTAMDRAKAMGFDVDFPVWRGDTTRLPIERLNADFLVDKKGYFFTPDKQYAEGYGKPYEYFLKLDDVLYENPLTKQISPMDFIPRKNDEFFLPVGKEASARRKSAVFDPARAKEADLLAGIGTVGAGLLSPAVLEYLRRRDEEGM